jgi:hypothetical protein
MSSVTSIGRDDSTANNTARHRLPAGGASSGARLHLSRMLRGGGGPAMTGWRSRLRNRSTGDARSGRVRGITTAGRIIALAAAAMLLASLPEDAGIRPALALGGDPVIAAAGDIACDPGSSKFNGGVGTSKECQQARTAALLTGVAAVLPLGDDQYYCGSLEAFMASYDLSWGSVKSISRPAVGNHEYLVSGGTGCNSTNAGAAGHFAYFGAAAGAQGSGYYSFDVGAWHLIALNSNCSSAGGCSTSSPQGKWLAADLAAHPAVCTLAYWHIPLFSSGGRANSNSRSLWNQLYAAGVDVVLNGHDHIYERFARQTPTGATDPVAGIREFIVGTGGANHTSLATIAANSQVRDTSSFGVLKLTLHAQSYDWQFEPAAGGSFSDSGSEACVGAGGSGPSPTPVPSPTSPPTASPSPSPSPIGTAAPTPTPTSPVAPSITLLTPVADAYVNASSPSNNFGRSTALRSDGSPELRSYIRFDLTGVPGVITRATLRFLPKANHSQGVAIHGGVTAAWTETGIVYGNAPSFDLTVLGVSGPMTSGSWVAVDVSGAVGTGSVTFVITTTSPTQTNIASRETADPPVLELETVP